MNKKIVSGSTLQECLKKGCKELNLTVSDVKYEILEEKKGLFKKKVVIAIETLEDQLNPLKELPNEINGKIKISGGKVIVINPKQGGNPAQIMYSDRIKIFIDGKHMTKNTEVFKESKIEFELPKINAKRELKINVTVDKMKAYISINYIPEIIYKIEDTDYVTILSPVVKIEKQIYPKCFSTEEIKEYLKEKKIVYGLIEKNIQNCLQKDGVENFLVAQGQPAIDDKKDKIDINFDTNKNSLKAIKEDDMKIDYKSVGFIKAVHKGYILATKIKGEEGINGTNIYGGLIKRKLCKAIELKVGNGCEIVNDNKVIATIDGKPTVNNYKFDVNNIYEVKGNVDMETGNIKFIGDVIVWGNVTNGMKVESESSIDIVKNIEGAEAISNGNVLIRQNAIFSKISAGKEDVERTKILEELTLLNENLNNLIMACKQIKKCEIMGTEINDGQIVKTLIENKFKIIEKLCNFILKSNFIEEELKILIKQKLIGIAPLSIRYYTEIYVIIEFLGKKIKIFKDAFSVPSNVEMSYCQECEINSSGDIIINGKGEYVSRINAKNNVVFISDTSIARGGVIKAGNNIKCGIVGSEGGVPTELKVTEKGSIWCKVCYVNTVFIVGKRKKTLESSSKDVHVYLDKEGEIVVDKLKL